jgi:hypothetical protein
MALIDLGDAHITAQAPLCVVAIDGSREAQNLRRNGRGLALNRQARVEAFARPLVVGL